jgi:putative transposase
MRRTYRYRLYPTRVQEQALTGQLHEACRLYNGAVQERRDAWRQARHAVSYYDQANQLRAIRAAGHLDLANFSACQDVLRRVEKTFAAFFRRLNAHQTPGYPRFKSHRRYDALTFPSYGDGCRLLDSGRLRLQAVGAIKVKLHRPLSGTVKTVTVKRAAGRWYVCFSVECTAEPLPPSSEAVGLDVGLTSFAVLSDGTVIDNPRYARQGQARLRIAQRKVARRKQGGHGRRKAVQLLQRAHAHVANQRNDFHHQVARTLVTRYGLIAVEALNIKGLAGGMLAKAVHDAGWGQFRQRIDDKAAEAGRRCVQVNPAGTTQRCSGCHTVVPKTLSERWHCCSACGLSLSRDENASREILRLGLSLQAPT